MADGAMMDICDTAPRLLLQVPALLSVSSNVAGQRFSQMGNPQNSESLSSSPDEPGILYHISCMRLQALTIGDEQIEIMCRFLVSIQFVEDENGLRNLTIN